MRATAIPQHESDFKTHGVDSYGKQHNLKPFQVTVPGTQETVDMVLCTMESGDESFFYKEETKKERVVIHFTAGFLKGDIGTLTQQGNHVSVPFVLARDGTLYNLWSSKYWSYHLGAGAQGGNTEMSKSGVAIEISNIGFLTPNGNDLVTYYSNKDVYCSLNDTQYYQKVSPFRGQQYYATFTDAQYTSLIKLLRYLTATYNIPRQFLDPATRFDVVKDVASFKGITTHLNYRPSDKWDIGPAFDWNRLISGVQA